MAIKMVREPSETPNISNVDDFVGLRYAYGNQDGYIINKLNECSFEIIGNTFKINSGRIVLQGIETDIDANGVSITIDNIATKRFYSVYLEVNLEIMTSSIKSSYDTAGYPIIDKGDDLTKVTNGIARMLLYTFDVSNAIITNVQKRFHDIKYSEDLLVKESVNSQKVNGLEIIKDEKGVIKIGNAIIPQKILIRDEPITIPSANNLYLNMGKDSLVDRIFEIEFINKSDSPDFVRYAKFKIVKEQDQLTFGTDFYYHYITNGGSCLRICQRFIEAEGNYYLNFDEINGGNDIIINKIYEIIE